MSPTNPGRSANAAGVIHPAEQLVPLPSGREHAWIQDDAATEDPPTTDPRLLRPATSGRVAPSRSHHTRRYEDPCNYLG